MPLGNGLRLSLGIGRQPDFTTNDGVSRLAIRSFPPPIRSFSPYSSSLHCTGSANSANVWLNAGR